MIDATLAAERVGGVTWDALVAGAGPAGSLLGRLLAARGLRVLIVDRSAFPRHKVCGGCLSARTWAHLRDLGHAPEIEELGGRALHRLHLVGWGDSVDLELPGGVALSRAALDAMLLRAAITAGADFLPAARVDLGEPEAGARAAVVHHGNADFALRSRVVVDATGLGGALLRAAGESPRAGSRRHRVGCSTITRAADDGYEPGTIYMAVADHGYVGAARLEDGSLNVAAAIDPRAVRELGAAAAAARLFRQAGMPPPAGVDRATWSGTPPLWQGPRRRSALRVLAVGDAAGYVEPFTGEGIGWALHSARLAAPLVARAAEDWSDGIGVAWERVHRRELQRQQRGCRALARLLRHPVATRLALAALRRRPLIAAPFVQRLHAPPVPAGGGA